MVRRAFTLIELLVVIAIIAILAAILFPVFAQAKAAAKKTTTLSNFKQTGTGIAIYTGDADDSYPLTFGRLPDGTHMWDYFHRVPNGWQAGSVSATEPRLSAEGQFWANSILPYVKSNGIYEANGLTKLQLVSGTQLKQPITVNSSMNGLLHGWSATAVAQPSKLPLIWNGMLRTNVIGLALTSPVLECTDPAAECRFNPGGGTQGTPNASGYGYTYWGLGNLGGDDHVAQYDTGSAYVSADTSARYIKMPTNRGEATAGMTNANPFSYIGDDGLGGWMIDCGAPGQAVGSATTLYPGFFRPDSEFNYTIDNCYIK